MLCQTQFDSEMQGTTTCASPGRSGVPAAPTHPWAHRESSALLQEPLIWRVLVQDVAPWHAQPGCGPPGLLTDLQLPLDPALAALPVVGLRRVVLGHHLHELAGQR